MGSFRTLHRARLRATSRLRASVLSWTVLGATAPLTDVSACTDEGVQNALVSRGVLDLVDAWGKAVRACAMPFGRYAEAFLGGMFRVVNRRSRDVLPLPVFGLSDLPWVSTWPQRDCSSILGGLNLCVAGLNFLGGHRFGNTLPLQATAVQRSVASRLRRKLVTALVGLSATDGGFESAGSFQHLFGRSDMEVFPPLVADGVDLPDLCGQLEPLSALPCSTQALLTNPSLLFQDGVDSAPKRCTFKSGDRSEYVKLVWRQLLARKVRLSSEPLAAADVFMIPKREEGRQREVWNGSVITSLALDPLAPPRLVTPAALVNLEASIDRPIHMSGRDASVYFDQLALPAALQPYMGRPFVTLRELHEHADSLGLGEQLLEFLPAGTPTAIADHGDLELTPLGLTWQMGFGWSSHVAQSFMVASCEKAGFEEASFLTHQGSFPPRDDEAISVATDDVLHFVSMSRAEAVGCSTTPLERLDRAWADLRVAGNDAKSFDLHTCGTALGVQLTDGVRIHARSGRLRDLLMAGLDLMGYPHAAPRDLHRMLGVVQWNDLLNRPLFSCLQSVYKFVENHDDPTVLRIPDGALSEIMLNLSLFPLWEADLTRPWWPFVPASDASPSFGFGLAVAHCSPGLSRDLGSAAGDWDHHVRLRRIPGDPPDKPRSGSCHCLPLKIGDFKPIFSVRAKRICHAGGMEATAVVLALRRITRCGKHHGHRGTMLVDAQAVAAALRKGRSSAGTISHQVATAGAICLACDLKLFYAYVPSECNPGDWPSRELRYHGVKPSAKKARRVTRLDVVMRKQQLLNRRVARAMRAWGDSVTSPSANTSIAGRFSDDVFWS